MSDGDGETDYIHVLQSSPDYHYYGAGITRIYDGDFKYLIVIPFAEITIKFGV